MINKQQPNLPVKLPDHHSNTVGAYHTYVYPYIRMCDHSQPLIIHNQPRNQPTNQPTNAPPMNQSLPTTYEVS